MLSSFLRFFLGELATEYLLYLLTGDILARLRGELGLSSYVC